MKIFDLVVKQGGLPATLDKLVPLSFIGAAAVKFYQAKVKLMDQLGISESQRKATLADGQDAGEMLLNIEARIGELLRDEIPDSGTGGAPKQPRLKGDAAIMPDRHRENARAIHRNPAAVKAVIAEARKNEDIPTKTAVLNKIKTDKAEAQLKAFREQHAKEPRKLLSEYLEKSIENAIQINTVIGQYFDNPDQVEAGRMKELMHQLKKIFDIVSEKTGRESWKQLA